MAITVALKALGHDALLWKSSQFFSSWSWTRPSLTQRLASSGVPTSTSSGPCSLPLFNVCFFHVSLRNFTLPFSCRWWACSSGRHFSWFEILILLVLTECIITLNCRPFTFVFPPMTLVYPFSCSSSDLVSWLSVVITMSPLSSCRAASIVPGWLELAAFIDSTSKPLVCVGFGSSATLTDTSLRALLGTGISRVP